METWERVKKINKMKDIQEGIGSGIASELFRDNDKMISMLSNINERLDKIEEKILKE